MEIVQHNYVDLDNFSEWNQTEFDFSSDFPDFFLVFVIRVTNKFSKIVLL